MFTIQFEIAPSYVNHFLKGRKIKGGVVVPVRRVDTGELGSLYIAHANGLKDHLVEKCKWVLSCWLKDDSKSPFEGGNSHSSVRTKFDGAVITASIEEKPVSTTNSFNSDSVRSDDEIVELVQFQLTSLPIQVNEDISWALHETGVFATGRMRGHYYVRLNNLVYEVDSRTRIACVFISRFR